MTALEARVRVPARGVDATVEVAAGGTLVLLGPNGSGKSTVLEAVAGMVPGADVRVTLDGVDAPRAPRDRRIGLLSQDDALFPTMSVRDNVAFGPRSAGASRAAARAEADAWLARVGLDGLGDRRPGALSGGQARRVAIARALAAAPRVLLLDEPFAGLDVVVASEVRGLVAGLLAGVTAVVTTHDALDAYALADTVAVMDSGAVVEAGEAVEVLTRPRTRFAARMGGRVLVEGTMRGGALEIAAGVRVPVSGGPGAGVPAAVAAHPGAVALAWSEPPESRASGSAWVADAVRGLEPRGDVVRVHGALLAADVPVEVVGGIAAGTPAWFGVPRGLEAYALTAGAPAR
ncbi:ABC transporter ATP-binding protein [Demequina phytophila]|uniref:ABC transporter ATP-binding protein n=1 Tax=Demequina phytophila TaxID=1638981 RepID=UPI000782F286|nr:ATP-binding cassette domain-containing protein [Demequina phytophila]